MVVCTRSIEKYNSESSPVQRLVATGAVQIESKPMMESVITVFALNNALNVPTSPPSKPNVNPAPTIYSKDGSRLANKTETVMASIIVVGHFHLTVN